MPTRNKQDKRETRVDKINCCETTNGRLKSTEQSSRGSEKDVVGATLTSNLSGRQSRRSGKATPFFKKGMFCVKLNVKPSNNKKQEICVGIDPGSKREAFTIKSQCHTFLNVLTETPH